MKKPFLNILCCVGLIGGTAVRAEIRSFKTVTFKTVNEYDASHQMNAVDKSAGFDAANSTGVGRNKDLVVGVNDFSSILARAAANDFGGVVNFDSEIIPTDYEETTFVVYMGRKTLRITFSDPICTDFYVGSTPISGPGSVGGEGFISRAFSEDGMPPETVNLEFAWKESGFASGEHVRAVAGTILGLSFSDEAVDNWVMKASLDNGDVIAVAAPVNAETGDAVDDTFFGVYAPEGRYIVGVSWVNSNAPSLTNNVSCGLDDFAFVTSKKNFVIPKNDVLYGDEVLAINELSLVTNTVDSVVVDPSSSGGDSSILFGSDKPGQGDSSAESASSLTNAPVDQSSSNSDYSVLFGSDRPGG